MLNSSLPVTKAMRLVVFEVLSRLHSDTLSVVTVMDAVNVGVPVLLQAGVLGVLFGTYCLL